MLPAEATDAEIEENEFCVICRRLGVGGEAKTPLQYGFARFVRGYGVYAP